MLWAELLPSPTSTWGDLGETWGRLGETGGGPGETWGRCRPSRAGCVPEGGSSPRSARSPAPSMRHTGLGEGGRRDGPACAVRPPLRAPPHQPASVSSLCPHIPLVFVPHSSHPNQVPAACWRFLAACLRTLQFKRPKSEVKILPRNSVRGFRLGGPGTAVPAHRVGKVLPSTPL